MALVCDTIVLAFGMQSETHSIIRSVGVAKSFILSETLRKLPISREQLNMDSCSVIGSYKRLIGKDIQTSSTVKRTSTIQRNICVGGDEIKDAPVSPLTAFQSLLG